MALNHPKTIVNTCFRYLEHQKDTDLQLVHHFGMFPMWWGNPYRNNQSNYMYTLIWSLKKFGSHMKLQIIALCSLPKENSNQHNTAKGTQFWENIMNYTFQHIILKWNTLPYQIYKLLKILHSQWNPFEATRASYPWSQTKLR